MRVSISVALAFTAFACSSGPSAVLDHRSAAGTGEDATDPAPSRKDAPQAKPSGNDDAPPPSAPPAAPAPSASTTPDAGPPPATTPPTPGSCAAPKCLAGGGLCGCKATDGAGNVVTMGCQDGQCGCFVGQDTTTTFDGTCDTQDDAVSLFVTNCGCN